MSQRSVGKVFGFSVELEKKMNPRRVSQRKGPRAPAYPKSSETKPFWGPAKVGRRVDWMAFLVQNVAPSPYLVRTSLISSR